MQIRKDKWEQSYKRKENHMYFPKEEIVKFLNRFIKRKHSSTSFKQLLNPKGKLKGLDFGCGIGRATILLHEFGIEGYGIDISQSAINQAKDLAKSFSYDLDKYFSCYDGENIPFDDDYFDFAIAEGVLDSLHFELAKSLIKQIDKVTKQYCFVSFISSSSANIFNQISNDDFSGEIEVQEKHEKGTIQSFFDEQKIQDFIKDTSFKIKSCQLHTIKDYTGGGGVI